MFITLLRLFSFPDIDTPAVEIPHLDKFVHFIFYFVVAVLGSMFIREQTLGKKALINALLISFLFAVIYGIIIEVIQSSLTSERSGDIYDVLANSMGAFCGTILIKSLFSGKTRLKWKD